MNKLDRDFEPTYHIMYRGPFDEVKGSAAEKFFDEYKYVRIIPYQTVISRLSHFYQHHSESIYGEDVQNIQGIIPDYENFKTANHGCNLSYRRFIKMHWLINDVKKNGCLEPIIGLLDMNNVDKRPISTSMHVHPGSFRQHVFIMLDMNNDMVVFDPIDLFYDYPKASLTDVLDLYHDVKDEVEIFFHPIPGRDTSAQILNVGKGSRNSSMSLNQHPWEEKIRHMFDKPLRIFIGYDSTHDKVADVCKESIKRYVKSNKIKIEFLDVSKIPGWTREYKDQSTEFAYTRFLVPYLSNYEGVSIYCDDDFIFNSDICSLVYHITHEHSVACVQHDFEKKYSTKFTNSKDVWYDKKLWSSLMVFNNSHPDCKKLTLESVQNQTGKYLHQFEWTQEERIASIPKKWNWCEGYSDMEDFWRALGVHYTRGGPWIEGMDCSDIKGLGLYHMINLDKDTYYCSVDIEKIFDFDKYEKKNGDGTICLRENK